jgi:hypothetical protein
MGGYHPSLLIKKKSRGVLFEAQLCSLSYKSPSLSKEGHQFGQQLRQQTAH